VVCGVLGVAICVHLFLAGDFLAPKAPSLLSPARDCVAIALRVGDREGVRDARGANGHRDSSMKVQFVS
jgi:hypothetical protein